MQTTPGVWEEIPANATIIATRNGVTIKGEAIALGREGEDGHKVLTVIVPALGTLKLDARDHWDVTYETRTLADELNAAQVGDLFSNRDGNHEIVKVTDEHVASRMLVGGYWENPEIRRIKDYEHFAEGVFGLRPRV